MKKVVKSLLVIFMFVGFFSHAALALDESKLPYTVEKLQALAAEIGCVHDLAGIETEYAIYGSTTVYSAVYDLFLVDADGIIQNTVAKEDDLYTSLIDGKYADTAIGIAYRALVEEADVEVGIACTKAYAPSSGVPAKFIAVPLVNYKGTLMVQVNIEANECL